MRWMVLLAATVALAAVPSICRGEAFSHSGSVVALDRAASTLVIEEVGPSGGSATPNMTRRAVTITPATTFVQARRMAGPAPSGWVGDFVEELLEPWAIEPGDFVTVLCQHDRRFRTALEVVVTVIGER